MTPDAPARLKQTVADPKLQLAIYSSTARLMDKRAHAVESDALPEYQELRTHANNIKRHTIENLHYYLEQFEANVVAHGGKVVFCQDAQEAADFVLGVAKERGASLIVKSKSMTTEEIDLNERLEHHQLEAVETDLGEYILQLAHQRPYHIVAPALHLTRYDVGEIFTRQLGVENEVVIEKQTMIARAVLRDKFLAADVGVTGANFLVADSGAVVLVENEGNARLSTSAPRIHIAVAGIEKVIPRAQDLATFLKLLGRSATGQPLSVYTSFLSGPRRTGEVDGPDEFYVLLLDNGRTKVLADPGKRESLFCIRCGACLNHCPVYRKIGGHNYPWVYSGPIGAILTPQFHGLEQNAWLPFASSLCGACAEVCPVKVDIPRILLELRSEVVAAKTTAKTNRAERLAFRSWAWVMSHPRIYARLAALAARLAPLPPRNGWIRHLPSFLGAGPLNNWMSQRDLPPPAAKSFRQLWAERRPSP